MHLTKRYLREFSIITFAEKILFTVSQVICGSSVANADAGLTRSVHLETREFYLTNTTHPAPLTPTQTPILTPRCRYDNFNYYVETKLVPWNNYNDKQD